MLCTRKHTYTSLFAIASMVCEHRWLLRSIDRAQQLVPWPDLVWTLRSSLCLALTQSPSPPLHPPCVSLFVSVPLLSPPHLSSGRLLYTPRASNDGSFFHPAQSPSPQTSPCFLRLNRTRTFPPLLLFLSLSSPRPLSTQY